MNEDEVDEDYIHQNDRYSTTINAGFPGKSDMPAKVIDDAIRQGMCYLVGSALICLRLVSVTTTVISHPYADIVLVTVIAEPIPLKKARRRKTV